ncbi:hypothetical protein AALB53_19345 [Lachnospiraceae bacterium 47-T17]
MNKNRIFKIVFLLIFLSIIYQIICEPFIGIANNGDFERMMGPSGLAYTKNAWAEENYDDYFWGYVINDFKTIVPQANGWYSIYQVNIFLSRLICGLFSKTGTYDIRYLGLVNMIFYLIGTGFILFRISKEKNKIVKVFLAIIVGMLTIDGYIIQYMNSFYCEIGTINALLIFYGSIAILFSFKNEKRVEAGLFIISYITGIAAVTIKQQDILSMFPIGAIFLLCVNKKIAGIWGKKKKIIFNLCLAVLIILPCIASVILNTGAGNVGCFNVICMDILDRSEHPQKHLNEMGFSDEEQLEIMDAVGENAYGDKGRAAYERYGSRFTRMSEVQMLISEPTIFISMIRDRSVSLFKDTPNLGNFMKETGAERFSKSQALRLWSEIKHKFYISAAGFYFLILFIAGIISIFHIKKGVYMHYIIVAMCLSNILRFATAILGDSPHDDIKHFFAINVEFDVIFFYLVIQIVVIACAFWKNIKPCNLKNRISLTISKR